jgi:hypothetical protein
MHRKHKKPAIALACLALCLFARIASAVVVLPKGASAPVMGYLIRHDERIVVVRQPTADGKSRELRFAPREIDELIITVSPERLETLDPAKPAAYFEYAEELAEKRRDPEARDAAIRLYAICAARGDDRVRHSALLGLIALARSPDEERRFRAATYLFDAEHDESVLATPADGKAASWITRWSDARGAGSLTPIAVLALHKLTEFDPAECVFRDGKWTKP